MRIDKAACFLALVLVWGCSLSDNPRRDERRGEYQRRRSTAFLLRAQGDLVADWDSQQSNDLADGVDWARNFVGERSLGGALVFMMSTLDRKARPREFSVISESLSVTDAVVSAQQSFLFYQTEDKGQMRYWLGAMPRPIPRPYAANKRSDPSPVKPFEILTEGRLSLVSWHPKQSICCYFDSDTREYLVAEVVIDNAKNQVAQIIRQRLKPPIPFLTCEQGAWTANGESFFTLWKKPRGQIVVWRFDNRGGVSGARTEGEENRNFAPVEFKWPDNNKEAQWSVLRYLPNPEPGAKSLDLIEAQQLNSIDRDKHSVFLVNRGAGDLQSLPGLEKNNGFAPRWNGPDNYVCSRAQAGLGGERGGRWREWRIDFNSRAQGLGKSKAAKRRFPIDFAPMDWGTDGAAMDRQLTWLLRGEVAAYIDPDSQRNIVLSDHSGKNSVNLLLDRSRSTPRILSLQVVSVRPKANDPESWRDYLYFVEEGEPGNVKRIDITPIGN